MASSSASFTSAGIFVASKSIDSAGYVATTLYAGSVIM
jgi:hypothetical protein